METGQTKTTRPASSVPRRGQLGANPSPYSDFPTHQAPNSHSTFKSPFQTKNSPNEPNFRTRPVLQPQQLMRILSKTGRENEPIFGPFRAVAPRPHIQKTINPSIASPTASHPVAPGPGKIFFQPLPRSAIRAPRCGRFSPKSDWSNRHSSTIVWAGLAQN